MNFELSKCCNDFDLETTTDTQRRDRKKKSYT